MKKEFIKSVATAVLGLALVSSCSSAKKEENATKTNEITKQEAHKCSAEKNACKAAKEAKKAKRNIEK